MLSIFLGCDRLSLLPPVHPDTGRGSRLQTLHLWGPGPRRHCSRHYSDCHVTCTGRWILNMMWIWICNLSAHYSLRNIRLQETQNIFAPGFMVHSCQVKTIPTLRWDAQQPADCRRGPDRVVHFCKYPDWAERRRGGRPRIVTGVCLCRAQDRLCLVLAGFISTIRFYYGISSSRDLCCLGIIMIKTPVLKDQNKHFGIIKL